MAFKGVVRFNIRCTKHVRFNPDTGGRSAVRGGCIHCQAMCDVADMARKLRLLVKETEANGSDEATRVRESRRGDGREVPGHLFGHRRG